MITERLTALGKDAGIDFSFGGKTGNTRDSHRLVELGKAKGADVQTRVVEELFKSYFEEEGDITSNEVLRQAGVRAGLEEVEVKNWLECDRGGDEVDKKVAEAQIRGVSGVPNFVFQVRVFGVMFPLLASPKIYFISLHSLLMYLSSLKTDFEITFRESMKLAGHRTQRHL